MARETCRLKGAAAAIYEEQKVKAIFRPLAYATLDAISISDADDILDVACGAGIVARCARERLGPSARISGVDLSEGMIDTAKALTADDPGGFDWRVAAVADMPFESARFSAVFCQQGNQFFPDDAAAVTEMRRVLAKEGRLFLSVRAGANDFFRAMAKALSRNASPEIGAQSLAPFAYDGAQRLPPILMAAGFGDVSVQTVSVDRIIETPATDIPKEIMATPVGAAVQQTRDAVMDAIVAEIIADCEKFRSGPSLAIPQRANLFCASAV